MIRGMRVDIKTTTWAVDYALAQQESEEVRQIRYLRERARIKLMDRIRKVAANEGITNKQRKWRKNQANACDKLRNQIKRYTISLQLLGVKHE